MKRIRANQNGMTLLEVLVAVFVLALVSLPLLNLFVFNTKLVVNSKDMGDTTYAAQAVMEELQPLGYADLYKKTPLPGAAPAPYQLNAVKRLVKVDRYPYGSFNSMVSGTACYAHLIVNGCSATFTSPDGKCYTGLSYSNVSITAITATIGCTTVNLNKPAGSALILIINAGSSCICQMAVDLNNSAACVLYAFSPADSVKQNITVQEATAYREFRKFRSPCSPTPDPIPTTMLVNAVCTVYKEDGVTVDSTVQNTLQVKLP